MSFIGAGERTAAKLLKILFPSYEIVTQIPLSSLTLKSTELSQRQKKETIDVLVCERQVEEEFDGDPYRVKLWPKIAVRLQGKKGVGLLTAEKHQRVILEEHSIIVVDIHKRDCPEIFKERFTVRAMMELTMWLVENGVNWELK